MFKNIYKGKKVLITGHTGFKGTWLTTWLVSLGAEVIGVSKGIPTKPSMYEALLLDKSVKSHFIDISDLNAIQEIIINEKPDFIFHLAAQAIVSESYLDPVGTIASNVIGTTNILEALRFLDCSCTVVVITSDKAYDNVEQVWGYIEDDKMGGKDIYSGSKGAAELIIKSYINSYFSSSSCKIKIAIGRAGNVIGGGDWAKDRIVVDCMRAWSTKKSVEIRSPLATRPWQHVLEPLSGYLSLGEQLNKNNDLHGEAFNFGPRAEQNKTVSDLLEALSGYWDFKSQADAFTVTDNIPFHEAGLLKLNCDKALSYLKWQATLDYSQTVKYTSEWYYCFYNSSNSIINKTQDQISTYQDLAGSKGLSWTM